MHYMKEKNRDALRVKIVHAQITYPMYYKIDAYRKQNDITLSTAIYKLLGKGLENEEK